MGEKENDWSGSTSRVYRAFTNSFPFLGALIPPLIMLFTGDDHGYYTWFILAILIILGIEITLLASWDSPRYTLDVTRGILHKKRRSMKKASRWMVTSLPVSSVRTILIEKSWWNRSSLYFSKAKVEDIIDYSRAHAIPGIPARFSTPHLSRFQHDTTNTSAAAESTFHPGMSRLNHAFLARQNNVKLYMASAAGKGEVLAFEHVWDDADLLEKLKSLVTLEPCEGIVGTFHVAFYQEKA